MIVCCSRRTFLTGVLVGPILLAGCGGESATAGPPEISYGRDTCHRCGMIVSDERYAAALVATDGTTRVFDDIGEMVETVRKVGDAEGRSDLRVTKVVPTLYRKTALADAILERLKAYFPDSLASTPLGFNVKIDEAQSHGKTIWEYAPSSRGRRPRRRFRARLRPRTPPHPRRRPR